MYQADLYLRFECFRCGRRVGLHPASLQGFPDKSLLEIQELMTCAKCGSKVCELAEVYYCAELPWVREREARKEAAE